LGATPNGVAIGLSESPSTLEQSFSLGDYVAILRRRIWWFVIPFVLAVAAAAAAALTWPPVYRATALVLIEEAEIPDSLVDVSFDTYVDRRLESITRRVMVTENLIDIIERFNLYPEMRADEPLTVVARRMRGDVAIRRIAAERDEATVAFEVHFDYGDPAMAQRVAQEIVSLYLNENIRQRRQLITGTAEFFARERAHIEERIDELSQRLATFKQEHPQLLPNQAEANERRLMEAENALRELGRDEQSLIDRETILMAQLAQLELAGSAAGAAVMNDPASMLQEARVELQTLEARYTATHPDILRTRAEVAALEAFLAEQEANNAAALGTENGELATRQRQLERELASLERSYGPEHPDVQHTRRELQQVGVMLDEQAGGDASAAGDDVRNPASFSIAAQLAVVRGQLDTLEARRAEIREQIERYRQRLDRMPRVELDYNEITSALADARARRNALLEKEQVARLSEAVEAEERGERFSLIEPPSLPNSPEKPNRKLILLAGLVLGFGAGGGSVAARHFLDDTVSGPGDIAREIGFEPLGIVPNITTPAERLFRLGRRLAVVVLIVGASGASAWYVHREVVPLDTAALLAWRELGERVGPYLPSDLQAQLGVDGS
jgi:uncharacterized protein involved in exopolysaccharide biosynthesis